MSSVRLAALAALVGCATLFSAVASAQVFRIVGPDGKVTFTDRPPPDAKATPAPSVTMNSAGSSSATLPAEVRAAASRFPVTLYTGSDCGPCIAARSFLLSRGVPFSERTITTQDDVQALQRLSGEPRLPFATIGGQHVRGFSDAEWGQYLDAAGYPKTSQLPRNWRNPAPTPLVAAQTPAEPRPQQAAQQPAPASERAAAPPLPSDPSPSNPAGIRF